ncbi:MAG: porin [Burkholderiaceae bacterium]
MKLASAHAAALAAVSLLAGTGASAQSSSVHLYGQLGAAVNYTTNQGSQGNSTLTVSNHLLSPSMFGIRGTEDLGNGMAAVFRLEADVKTDTGVAGAGNRLFNRQAFVGLNLNPSVTVTLGRQLHAHADRLLETQDVYHTAGTSAHTVPFALYGNRYSSLDSRVDSSIKLRARGPAGFSGGASYGFSSGEDKSYSLQFGRDVAAYSIGGWYVNQRGANPITGTTRYPDQTMWGIGGSMPVGPVRLYMLYADVHIDGTQAAQRTQSNRLMSVGASWQPSPSWTLKANYVLDRGRSLNGVAGRDGRKNTLVASVDYALSRRTSLNLTVFENRYADGYKLEALNIALLNRDPTASSTRGISVGMRHAF